MATQTKKKSLRESLKELENPASAINFEDSEDELTSAKITDQLEGEDADFDEVKTFGNLRKKAFQNDEVEPKYSGNKISRRNIEKWSDEEESDDDESVEEDEENMSDENEENSDLAANCVEESGEEVESEHKEGADESIDESLSEYEEDDEEDDAEFDDEDDGMMDLDLSKIPKDLLGDGQALDGNDVSEDDDDDINNFAAINQSNEKRKGEATRSQLDILDKLLESRIRLQKSMQVTNTLPQKKQMKIFLKEGGPQMQEAHRDAKGSLICLLNNLLKLQEDLFKATDETKKLLSSGSTTDNTKKTRKTKKDDDEEILSDTDDEANKDDEIESESEIDREEGESESEEENNLNLPSKRKSNLSLDDYEEELSKRHKAFCGYRDATILKWYDKTRLMTGKINKGFSAFETSTLQQIKQVMSDKQRLMKRSQLKRTQYKILGRTEEEANPTEEEVDSHLKNYDTEIFDDSDFYHEMLKELIERKSNLTNNGDDDPIASGRRWLQLQKLRTKTKRKVDTRASKGRKVRYDIHSKLVSLMAPQEIGVMPDQARNDLFSSLFGGGTMKNDIIDR